MFVMMLGSVQMYRFGALAVGGDDGVDLPGAGDDLPHGGGDADAALVYLKNREDSGEKQLATKVNQKDVPLSGSRNDNKESLKPVKDGQADSEESKGVWIEVERKKKRVQRAFVADQDFSQRAPVEETFDICQIEVPYIPNTSSRRAMMKWAMARKGGLVGTKDGLGYFVYGTFGANGIEF